MQLNLENKKSETNYRIKLPDDSIVKCPISYKLVPITIGGATFPGDLIQFDFSDFDIILGMNCCVLMKPKLTVKTLRLFWGIKVGEKYVSMGKKRKNHVL